MAKSRIEIHGSGKHSWRVVLYDCILCGQEMETDYREDIIQHSPEYYESQHCAECGIMQNMMPAVYKLVERIVQYRVGKLNERIQTLEVEIYGKHHPTPPPQDRAIPPAR